ncbi:MAG TPA: XdhC family protein, partial [Nitrospirota bacterium]
SDFQNVFARVNTDPATFIVIATRGHNHDLVAVKAALGTNAGYIGLLGSRRKKGLLMNALRESGFSPDDINRVIIPVGLEIGSTTPDEIAVSIMAQIIQRRRANGTRRGGHTACGGIFRENGATETAPSAG